MGNQLYEEIVLALALWGREESFLIDKTWVCSSEYGK